MTSGASIFNLEHISDFILWWAGKICPYTKITHFLGIAFRWKGRNSTIIKQDIPYTAGQMYGMPFIPFKL